MGKMVDDAILSVNRAAEDAAKSASPIFVNAVKKMSIQDAVGICAARIQQPLRILEKQRHLILQRRSGR